MRTVMQIRHWKYIIPLGKYPESITWCVYVMGIAVAPKVAGLNLVKRIQVNKSVDDAHDFVTDIEQIAVFFFVEK